MTDPWDEVATQEPSQAQMLKNALDRAKHGDNEEIDPEYPDCPLCRAAAGQDVTLIDTIGAIRSICPTCSESIGTNPEEEVMREIRGIR